MKIQAHVIDTSHIDPTILNTLLDAFKDGNTEPVITGRDQQPEAAIIPFQHYLRLLVWAQNAHDSDAKMLQARIKSADNARTNPAPEDTAPDNTAESNISLAEFEARHGNAR